MLALRPRVRKIVFVAVQGLITLVLLEGALRFLAPHRSILSGLLYTPSARTEFDDVHSLEELLDGTVLGFSPFSRHQGFILNSRSFRTREYTAPRAPGIERILVLGDSYSFASGGVAFSEMWHSIAEREMRAGGDEVEVFSLGVPGVGPRFELRLFELESAMVRPDRVVLAFYVGNDFTDEQRHELDPWIQSGPYHHSFVLRLVRNLFGLWGERDAAAAARSEISSAAGSRVGGFVDRGGAPPGPPEHDSQSHFRRQARRFRLVLDGNEEELRGLVADSLVVLRRLDAAVRSIDADLLVMIIPEEYQIDPELRMRISDHLGIGEGELDIEGPQRRLIEGLSAAEIPYLDLLSAFREWGQKESLYWATNSHWNVEGNALAGRLIAQELSESRR